MTPHIQIKAVGWWKDLSFSPQLFGSDWRHDVATESDNQYVHDNAYNELFILQDISGAWRYLPSARLLWYVVLHTVFKEEDINIETYKLSKTPYEFWFRIMDAASDMVDQHQIPGFHEARWGGRGLRKSKSTFASGRKWPTWPLDQPHEGYQHDYSLKFEISYDLMSSIGFCVVLLLGFLHLNLFTLPPFHYRWHHLLARRKSIAWFCRWLKVWCQYLRMAIGGRIVVFLLYSCVYVLFSHCLDLFGRGVLMWLIDE